MLRVALGLGTALLLVTALTTAATVATGVVVEAVIPGGAADRAGVQPGDVLLSWRRTASPADGRAEEKGELSSPFDLREVEAEQAPRGKLAVQIRRQGQTIEVVLPPGKWRLEVRPALAGDELHAYQAVVSTGTEEGQVNVASLAGLAKQVRARGDQLLAAWYGMRAVEEASGDEQVQAADAVCSEALEQRLGSDTAQYWLLRACGEAARVQLRYEAAQKYHQQALRSRQSRSGESLTLALSLNDLGKVAWRRGAGDLPQAESFFSQALVIRQRLAPESLTVARSYYNMGIARERRGDPQAAAEWYRRSVAIRERLAPVSLDLARSLYRLGLMTSQLSDMETARRCYRRALEIQEQLVPDSMILAATVTGLGDLAFDRGDLDTAAEHFLRCLAIVEQAAPGEAWEATALTNLGTVAHQRGDLAAAESYYRRAIEVGSQHRRPADALYNYGMLALHRGDLATSEACLRESLDIWLRVEPSSPRISNVLNSLGGLAIARGDLDVAEEALRKALAINQEQAPDGLGVAWNLNNLGDLADERSLFDEAEVFHQRALVIRERISPGSLDVAWSLERLGTLARKRGELQAAEELLHRCLAIQHKQAPDSFGEAAAQRQLAFLAIEQGHAAAAEHLLSNALAIRQRLAPRSYEVAESLHDLGRLLQELGRNTESLDHFARAIAVLEVQDERIGGTGENRMRFRAKRHDQYGDYLQMLVTAGRGRDALHVLERSRARAVLMMLAERDLVFSGELPAELERERRVIATRYDRLRAELSGLSPSAQPDEVEQLQLRLRELRRRQEEIREEIRPANPRLAALRYPEALDAEAVQRSLDPGTVLLAYTFVREQSYLFVVAAAGNQPPARADRTDGTGEEASFAVLELPAGRAEIEAKVRLFRSLIASGARHRRQVQRHGRQLYDLLVKPAEQYLTGTTRIVICPEGALHMLPFTALMRTDDNGEEQYLVQWKPLHQVLSATLYAELRRQRGNRDRVGRVRVAAFGDPSYPDQESGQVTSVQVRALLDAGRLTALPATRREVEEIAAIWGDSARTYLGSDASEERAKAIGREPDIIHFACHGILDEHSPLDSGLVLSIPEEPVAGRDNGLLQAWEVIEQVRIDADLVVLSGCETALGEYLGGEGLIGLTRAVQYAGATSIVASLWAVPDESTALMMRRFHAGLKQGQSIDEALRRAQIALLRGPLEVADAGGGTHTIDASHPFAWAGFLLIGDWR